MGGVIPGVSNVSPLLPIANSASSKSPGSSKRSSLTCLVTAPAKQSACASSEYPDSNIFPGQVGPGENNEAAMVPRALRQASASCQYLTGCPHYIGKTNHRT